MGTAGHKKLLFVSDGVEELRREGKEQEKEHG